MSDPTSGGDLRGFLDPLEPARQRARHHLDEALYRLARSLRALREAEASCRAWEHRLRDSAARCAPRPDAPIDPVAALAQTRHLASMQRHAKALAQQLALRGLEVGENRARVERAEAALAALNEHRALAYRAHRDALALRQQRAADQDWLARAYNGGTR